MSRDGLLPRIFSRVNPRTRTPIAVIVGAGLTHATIAGFAPITMVASLVNIGTLAAFCAVCIGVIVLRYRRPDLARPFRVPWMPVLPLAGVAGCVWLMAHLGRTTWLSFIGWMLAGLAVYFLYSVSASVLAREPR
jgi:APA family basic amino acid/polyamine antiporter